MTRYPKNLIVVFVFVSLLSFLWSCSSSYPSESDARQVLEERSKKGGMFRITSFHKTDGQAFEQSGISGYKLDYEAKAECLKKEWNINQRYAELSALPNAPIIECTRVGEIHNLKGTLTFQKTENGWKPIG